MASASGFRSWTLEQSYPLILQLGTKSGAPKSKHVGILELWERKPDASGTPELKGDDTAHTTSG